MLDYLLLQLKARKLPLPEKEYRFEPKRRWRADYAWPSKSILLEIEGGTWTQGRHVRPAGYLSDIEKYNQAAELGYRVFRCTPRMVQTGAIVDLLERVLK